MRTSPADRRTPEVEWLRANPHRLHLGRVGFRLTLRDGARPPPRPTSTTSSRSSTCGRASCAAASGSTARRSRWRRSSTRGSISSRCASSRRSWRRGRIAIRSSSPTGAARRRRRTGLGPRPTRHGSSAAGAGSAAIERRLDDDRYHVRLGVGARRPAASRRRGTSSCSSRPRAGGSSEAVVGAFSPTAAGEPLPDFADGPTGRGRALGPLLVDRRGDRPLGEPRPALARAGAPHRPLAVPGRDPVRRTHPAPGDRAHLQQLARQVPPRDALVARGPLRPLGPPPSPASGASGSTPTSSPAPGRPRRGRATRGRGGPR